jgi:hypothetical protein
VSAEATLLSALQEIKKASFSKTSLEFFAKVPETTTLILKTRVSGDNEKILATQVYLELLNKLSYFAQKIAKKEITPNEEELEACEKCIDAIYNSNEELLRDAPEVATTLKISKFQTTLLDLKKTVQEKRNEKPPKQNDGNNDKNFPMTWRGFTLLLIIFSGFALLVWFIAYKRKKS